jgi:hypothetical protein
MAWTSPGPCTHYRIEEIKNGYDRVIGGQCRTCLAVIWGVSKCAGCGKDKARLTYTLEASRYCGKQCRDDQLKRARDAAAVKLTVKPATAAPGPGRGGR